VFISGDLFSGCSVLRFVLYCGVSFVHICCIHYSCAVELLLTARGTGAALVRKWSLYRLAQAVLRALQ
jgi:hypothetical protein